MSTITTSSNPIAHGGAGRRLATGVLVSLLTHALVLSLQFGVPGFGQRQPAPLTIVLAPAVPVIDAAADPVAPPLAPAEPPVVSGLRLVDRAPEPAPPQPRAPAPAAAKRARPRRAGTVRPPEPPPVPVIASESVEAAEFVMPPLPEGADPLAVQEEAGPDEGGAADTGAPGAEVAADENREQVQVEADLVAEAQRASEEQARVALMREQEQARAAEQALAQALAQQREADQLARQRAAAEQEQILARQQAEAQERERVLAQQRLDDQRREQAAREAAAVLAARRQAEDEAIRREAEATAALERARRQAQEDLARRQADEAARQVAEEAARRLAEESARRIAQDKARREADEAARLAAQQAAARQPRVPAAPGSGDDPFGEGAGGALPKGAGGSGLAGRARELVRGLQIPGAIPDALRPAAEARAARSIVAAGGERDVSLRMYVDSFRQKIERNAALHHMPDRVRIDPLVSVSLRSDGSVGDVAILRSSGRPDMDQAVLRIVRLNARYSAFPASVAAQYDVIEIRRIWSFAEGLKLLEEMR